MDPKPYYLGISLPEELSAEIAHAQQELVQGRDMRQPLEPHITLIHPPGASSLPIAKLAIQARTVARQHLPLTITLEGFGAFGSQGVYIRVEQSAQLMRLQQALVRLLPPQAQDHHYPNGQPYTPHVTLAQARRPARLPQALMQQFTHRLAHLLPVSFTVKHLTLYRWQSPRQYNEELL